MSSSIGADEYILRALTCCQTRVVLLGVAATESVLKRLAETLHALLVVKLTLPSPAPLNFLHSSFLRFNRVGDAI